MTDFSSHRPQLPSLQAIGIIHTPFVHAEGTPIQSACAGGAEGVVEVFPEYAAGLKDLGGFERVWLIYFLDRAKAGELLTRPYLDNERRGIFATRSPARPNSLGLSPVQLVRVENNRLVIAQVDILDGTPLVDIKPYVPEFDRFDVPRIGWYAGKSATGVVADARFEAKKA